MPISYLSKPYESNPYVVPLDLGLLAKVNQYKQSQFYQNTDRLNTQFTALNSLDILNDFQKTHAKGVVDNLSTKIRSMGGLDYSDPNVANAISGYAGDVYNDKTVLNGILSTKSIRSYQQNTEKMKTDPKLSKYYDSSREWYDTQAPAEINPNSATNYIHGDINAVYSGPSAPTPSMGSDWELLTKEITKINPNITSQISKSGNRFFLDITTHKVVSPSQIRQMVDGKIDGRVAEQLNIHAAYNYYALTGGKYSKEMGIAEYTKYHTDNLERLSDGIDSLKLQISIEPDNERRARLEELLQDGVEQLPRARQNVKDSGKQFSDLWDKSKTAAFYNLYTNKLKDDISSVYSYDQVHQQLVVDQEAVANARMDLEAFKQNYKLTHNADGTKKVTIGTELLGPLERNTQNDKELEATAKVNRASIEKEIDDSQAANNAGLYNVIFETAKLANIPGLFDDDKATINNDPNANPISHSNLLKQVAQITGNDTQLEKEDIDRVLQNVEKGGSFDQTGEYSFNKGSNTQVYYNPKTKKPIVNLTAKQITFFKKVQQIMNDGANGKDISGKITNAGAWREYLNRYSIEQNSIENNRRIINVAKKQVYDKEFSKPEYRLTEEEKVEATKYFEDQSKYHQEGVVPLFTPQGFLVNIPKPSKLLQLNPVMSNALSKIWYSSGVGGAGALTARIKDNIDDMLGRTSNRTNFYTILLPDQTKDLEKQFPNIKNYMHQVDSGIRIGDIAKDKEDLDPIAIVTDGNKYFVKYGSRKDLDGKKGYAEITEENLERLGVPTVPFPSLEKTLSQNGHLVTPIYIDPIATRNKFNIANKLTGPIKIDIFNMNAGGDRNNDNYTPAILYNGKAYMYKAGNSRSGNAALEYITKLIQNNTTVTSIEQLISILDEHNQQ